MDKKENLTNGSFAVQFAKACYGFQFMREVFPGVKWHLDVDGDDTIKITAYFDDTPESCDFSCQCAKQLATILPDMEVKTIRYDKATTIDPFWLLRGKLEINHDIEK